VTVIGIRESRSVRAPLGLRLLSAVDDRPVRGLLVTACPLDAPDAVTVAVEGPSGAYGFHRIAGIPDLLDGADAPTRPVAVRVEDPARLHLESVTVVQAPTRLLPAVPADGRGLYLFPSVTHPQPPGFALVRAWLHQATSFAPAAHAVMEVSIGEVVAFGVADADGAVAVLVPLPAVDGSSIDAGPARWPVDVRVRWRPGDHERVAALDTPTTSSSLTQALATIDRPPDDLEVQRGVPLAVVSDGDERRRLLVDPA
jgi:hypothetical protein